MTDVSDLQQQDPKEAQTLVFQLQLFVNLNPKSPLHTHPLQIHFGLQLVNKQ